MTESRLITINNENEYLGLYPTVFKKIDNSDISITPFQVNKSWTVFSGSATSSALPLNAIYSNPEILPALGSELTYNDSANINGSLQSVTYFSLNHMFYKYKKDPMKTYGPTDLNKTPKRLFESASILSFPQVKIGEGIKLSSFTMITDNNAGVYGLDTYGSSMYGVTSISLNLKSDRYSNIYDTSFNTDSIVSDCKYYEGFNEYFDISRIEYQSENVTYTTGITTTTGASSSIGKSAYFDNNGYIKTAVDGLYNRDTNYAISFFIQAQTGSINDLIITKANSNTTPQYPFKIYISGSASSTRTMYFKIAGSTTFTQQISSSFSADDWHHVVCQKSGSVMQMFVDNTLISSASSTLLSVYNSPFTASARIDNRESLSIGGYDISTQNFSGYLDEIRIYNKALTNTEIGYLADRTEGGTMLQTNVVGNIFSKQGLAVISSPDYRFNNILSSQYTASYKSTKTINELSILTKLDAGDFNMSLNNSLTMDNDTTYQSFVSSSAFSPYITTIGLYDDSGQLLAIGKVAQPIKKRNDVDMNFLIRIDLDKNIQ
jgi:hypothetical protein